MNITGNTILITGGATGIGFALAKAFVASGNEVIICGRREHALLEAKKRLTGLHVRVCDVADPAARRGLFEWVAAAFPNLNVLVNNAGIQRESDFKKGASGVNADDEIAINLAAPIALSALFIPHLTARPASAIVNVSSGLAFVPLAFLPVYCATKAGLHSFSLSLRHLLKDTSIRVFEIIPPIVDTELDHGARSRREQENRGIPPEEVAVAALAGMEKDEFEIPVGFARGLWQASKNEQEKIFERMNG